MGILDTLRQMAIGAVAQVNPFDDGKTYGSFNNRTQGRPAPNRQFTAADRTTPQPLFVPRMGGLDRLYFNTPDQEINSPTASIFEGINEWNGAPFKDFGRKPILMPEVQLSNPRVRTNLEGTPLYGQRYDGSYGIIQGPSTNTPDVTPIRVPNYLRRTI